MKRAALLLAIAAAAVPGVASADFLYNAIPPDRMPYVFVIMDNSYSMIATDADVANPNPYGVKDIDPGPGITEVPMTRMDSAKEALRSVLDDIEGVGVGFIHFYPNARNIDLNGVNGTDPTKPGFDPTDAMKVAADLAHSEIGRACGACLVTYPDGVADRTRIINELNDMVAETDTALAVGLRFAGKMIHRVANGYTNGGGGPGAATIPIETADTAADDRANDDQLECRKYFVILMTDGEDTCSDVAALSARIDPITGLPVGSPLCQLEPAGAVPSCALRAGHVATLDAIQELRDLNLGSGVHKMVATFIIGFGRGADPAFKTAMDAYARAGRTTYDPDTKSFLCMEGSGSFGDSGAGPCAAGAPAGDPDSTNNGALMASNSAQLREGFRIAFDAALAGEFVGSSPIVYTVPQEVTEMSRVSRNFLAYGAFRMPRSKGVLYGIRLYTESATPNVFEFTDLRPVPDGDLDMANCGNNATNPCVFEAGSMLTDRVSGLTSDRRIFTAKVNGTASPDNGKSGTTYILDSAAVVIPPPDAVGDDMEKGIPTSAWQSFMDTPLPPTVGGITAGAALDDLPAGLKAQAGARFTKIGDKLNTFYANAGSEAFHKGVSAWLHGLPEPTTDQDPGDPLTWDRAGRRWALGDILHSSVAIVGPPGSAINAGGYSDFRGGLVGRPPMIYVGANDGMIHAFYAGPDLAKIKESGAPRWEPGEEAWAFLPPSQFANAAYNILLENDRFDSQDLSCRVEDVLVNPASYATRACTATGCTCDAPENEKCGWRTVLLCGQGWGGNWYTALDVTWDNYDSGSWEPTPVPMWEFTNFTPDNTPSAQIDPELHGTGRTWSMPGLGMVNDQGDLRTVAMIANGYNSSQGACGALKNAQQCDPDTVSWNLAWAALNLPYLNDTTSVFPRYGEGVETDVGNMWAIDMASGDVLKKFTDKNFGAIIADVPVIDSDGDRLLEASYPATWGADSQTRVGRIYFPDADASKPGETNVSLWGMCATSKGVIEKPGSKPFTTGLSVFRHPYKREAAFLFAGTGVDKESGQQHPDLERFASGNDWKFYGIGFTETGSSDCDALDQFDLCPGGSGTEKFELGKTNHEERLVGAPTLVRQPSGQDWLVFTTMTPPTSFCSSPQTYLWCMDITNPQACLLCGSLDGTVGAEQSTEIVGAPTSPTSADGQIYTVGSDGPNRSTPGGTGTDPGGNNQSGTTGPVGGGGGGPAPGPNQNRPRFLPVSFREIF